MKKTLLAISLCSCFGFALADSSNVTVYGVLDAGLFSVHGASDQGSVTGLGSGRQSYSRLGFRGDETLGDDLHAIFALEQGFSLANGELGVTGDPATMSEQRGQMFNSQSYVGLRGNFGTVKLGRQFSPLYEAYAVIDPFANGFAANINQFFGTDAYNNSDFQRTNSSVTYTTPDNGSGFRAELAYGFGGVAGSVSAMGQFGASLRYSNGPLTLTYAYHHANLDSGTPTDITFPVMPTPAFKTQFLGAVYDLGPVKLHAAFDQNQQGIFEKNQDYLVGLTVPLGANTVFADYTHKRNQLSSHADADQYAIGMTHSLSKRSNVYAAFTSVRNDEGSFVTTLVPGNSVNTIELGVKHSF